jgi:hypothetical protein
MTNTKSFLAKTTAIACLGLREGLEPSHVLGVKGGLLVRSYRVSVRWFLGGAIAFSFSELVSRVHQHQAKRRTPGVGRSQ